MKAFQLREQSQAKITEARSTEDAAKATELYTEAKALAERANQMDEMETLERSFDTVVNKREVEDRSAKIETADEVRDFAGWMRGEARAQSIAGSAGADGGVTVPTTIHDKIIKNAVTFGPMLNGAIFDVVQTASGAPITYVRKSGSRRARLLAEGATATALTNKLGSVSLGAHKLTTDEAIASNELIQDSAVDIVEWLVSELAESYGLGANYQLTMGSGAAGNPTGIVTALTATAKATAAAALTAQDVLDLQYEVNAAYRSRGVYMFNSKVELFLRSLKDSNGNYIWQPAFKDGSPATIFGQEYVVNDDMPDHITKDNVCVIFGDMKSYKSRVSRSLEIKRLNELHALTDQTAWVGFARLDGNLIQMDGLAALKVKGV